MSSDVKNRLGQVLSPVLDKALADYQSFLHQSVSLDPKEFSAFQNACKGALAHIALLLKLSGQSENPETEPDFATLIEEARSQPFHFEKMEEEDAQFD